MGVVHSSNSRVKMILIKDDTMNHFVLVSNIVLIINHFFFFYIGPTFKFARFRSINSEISHGKT